MGKVPGMFFKFKRVNAAEEGPGNIIIFVYNMFINMEILSPSFLSLSHHFLCSLAFFPTNTPSLSLSLSLSLLRVLRYIYRKASGQYCVSKHPLILLFLDVWNELLTKLLSSYCNKLCTKLSTELNER